MKQRPEQAMALAFDMIRQEQRKLDDMRKPGHHCSGSELEVQERYMQTLYQMFDALYTQIDQERS